MVFAVILWLSICYASENWIVKVLPIIFKNVTKTGSAKTDEGMRDIPSNNVHKNCVFFKVKNVENFT